MGPPPRSSPLWGCCLKYGSPDLYIVKKEHVRFPRRGPMPGPHGFDHTQHMKHSPQKQVFLSRHPEVSFIPKLAWVHGEPVRLRPGLLCILLKIPDPKPNTLAEVYTGARCTVHKHSGLPHLLGPAPAQACRKTWQPCRSVPYSRSPRIQTIHQQTWPLKANSDHAWGLSVTPRRSGLCNDRLRLPSDDNAWRTRGRRLLFQDLSTLCGLAWRLMGLPDHYGVRVVSEHVHTLRTRLKAHGGQ